MEQRTASSEPSEAPGSLRTRCAGCNVVVHVHLRSGIVEAANGNRTKITYADEDIAVWDCPSCAAANAEVLREI